MKTYNQADIIKQMSNRELTRQLMLTQCLIFFTGAGLSYLFFTPFWQTWRNLLHVSVNEIVWYGVLPGILILVVDLILMRMLPSSMYDDGGINRKVFKNRSVFGILGLTLLIAVCEEVLFRGVLHSEFGFFTASIAFALMHIRYLTKAVLLISVLFVSFLIGYMFELTGSLWVTITSHFIVDAVLGLLIRFGYWSEGDEETF